MLTIEKQSGFEWRTSKISFALTSYITGHVEHDTIQITFKSLYSIQIYWLIIDHVNCQSNFRDNGSIGDFKYEFQAEAEKSSNQNISENHPIVGIEAIEEIDWIIRTTIT